MEGAVVIAYDYPLLGLFWTVVFLSFWIGLLFLVCFVFVDIIRSRDVRGWAKGLWLILVLFVPLLGAVAYLIVRQYLISERETRQTQRAR